MWKYKLWGKCKVFIYNDDGKNIVEDEAFGVNVLDIDDVYILPSGGLIYVDGNDVEITRYFDYGIQNGANMLLVKKID